VVSEDGVEVVIDNAPALVGGHGRQIGHALQPLWVGGSGNSTQHGALKTQRPDLSVNGEHVRRGDVGQRRICGQHALDIVQPDAEIPQRPDEPRPRDGVRPEQAIARLGAAGLGKHARIRVEPQPPHRDSGARGELADGHIRQLGASTEWRVNNYAGAQWTT
jgi:hypothetical protein